jgi:predicted RNA-binding protein associated with RNAse of E/G family
MSKEIVPGQWRTVEYMVDYRVERLSNMLVERATWNEDAPVQVVSDTVVAAPGYIWFRFWVLKAEQIVQKYFDDSGQEVGIYAPICKPFLDADHGLATADLILGLWNTVDGRVMVLNEAEYEAAVLSGLISADEAKEAELRIREMTAAAAKGQFPQAIIRNFELELGQPE